MRRMSTSVRTFAGMYVTRLPALLFAGVFAACNLGSPSPESAEEVGEEVGEFVEGITPASAKAGEATAPPALTTPGQTLAAAEEAGGLLALAPAAATAAIDQWVGTLRGNPDVDDADDLVDDLARLRELLGASPVDGEAVAEVLEDLARETRQAARDADNEPVAALAEALEAAAEQLDD